MKIMKDNYDLIIIGAGPAGLSAAIYARRGNLDVLLIEENSDGGKLSKISKIDNYPGFTSISGFDLAQNLLNHAKAYDVEILNNKVIKIEKNKVVLIDGKILNTETILIATGSKQRKLDIPQADVFEGKGISYCATCDGFFFRNKEVVVIGNNNEALNESLYLTDLVSKLTIINRTSSFNAESSLIKQIQSNNKIDIKYNCIPESLIIENEKIIGVNIKNIINNANEAISCSGVFPYMSFNPSTDFVDESIIDEYGFIKANNDMSTSIEGIYAAGDCIQKQLRQIVTACSDGAIAATSIIKYLRKKA